MDYIIAEYPEDSVFDTDTKLRLLNQVRNGVLPHKGDMIKFSKWKPETKITNYWCKVVTILHQVDMLSDEASVPYVLVRILNKQNNTSKE